VNGDIDVIGLPSVGAGPRRRPAWGGEAMRFYDIFNGDADGLCALQQLRLADPVGATCITGAKRDIALVERVVAAPGDRLTVCDISLESNLAATRQALDAGAQIRWFDHHRAGEPFEHPGLARHIDLSSAMCTSAIVDRHLDGAHRAWAVVGAFGDNMGPTARVLAARLELDAAAIDVLRRLGESLNYNAYGDDVGELLFDPEELHRRMRGIADPLRFAQDDAAFGVLESSMRDDLERSSALSPILESASVACFELPDAAWSRRVSGVLANRLARAHPGRAHALLTPSRGLFTVSIRAPIDAPSGADLVAIDFPGGGGRAGAAGIGGLMADDVPRLLNALRRVYG
jgi:hypothetical protein